MSEQERSRGCPTPLRPLAARPRVPLFAIALSALVAALPSAASAADVEFEGFYRSRGRFFDTLSLDRSLGERSDGLSAWLEHRLWLRPRFLITDEVSVTAEIKGLDNVRWGDQVGAGSTFVDTNAPTFDYDLSAPTSTTNGLTSLQDFTLWRAWGEVNTKIGRFGIGRMPLHWGKGIWLNDGLSTAPLFADHGDTTDRLFWEYLVNDQFFLKLAADLHSEGFVNDPDEKVDDWASYSLSTAYRAEDLEAGILVQLDRRPSLGFTLFTADASADVTLGKLDVSVEAIGQFGGGDLDDVRNDAAVTAFGGAATGQLDLDAMRLAVDAGFASGDGTANDNRYKTFTFDRDYSVGLMMFEQIMPTLAAAAPNSVNLGRSYEVALTGEAVSNALYLRPKFTRRIVEGFEGELYWLGARAAKVPETFGARRSYGMEGGLTLRYVGIEHLRVEGTFAGFLPGTYYKSYTDANFDSFDDTVFGGQLGVRFDF